jgi:uncharacterized repeat protein (TIGR03803 family)
MVPQSPLVTSPFTADRGYRVLFRFKGKDGAGPQGLTALDGLLYGTTSSGGRNDAGTFFSLTTSGEKRTLHDFSGKNGSPSSILTPLNGLLYGWTDDHCNNTSSDCGEIFSLDTSGHERTLHVFHEQDQLGSVTSLTAMNGVLYGTTANGLSPDDGTVFSLTPNGDFQVLYHFQGQFTPSNDGAWPDSIVALNGTLYGTTIYGGKNGNGTVFNVTTTGKEHVVYSFGKALSGDGADPNAVMLLHGKLYGTTWSGGDSYECWGDPPIGCGTVFSVTTLGEERVLYSFQGQSAGYFANPTTGLAALKGKLYGTTGSGILFSITTGGTEKTLLSLKHCEPCSVLTPLKGTLYGTMPNGGKHHSGIAFAFTP